MIKVEDVDEFIECICEIFNIKRKLSFVETAELTDLYNNMWSTEKISYDDGYEAGYDEGKDDGYDNGFDDGKDEGEDDAKEYWLYVIKQMKETFSDDKQWSNIFKDFYDLRKNDLIDEEFIEY